MAAIWNNSGDGWKLLKPHGFPDEAALHTLVEEAPQMLPLSGSPSLIVVGREVQLGNGWADLIAIERDGRVAIIEIKLGRNPEAKRTIVAQILNYAAHLHGVDSHSFGQHILGQHLRNRGFDSLEAAFAAEDQEGSFDRETFSFGLEESLAEGRFRLIIVLDSAPDELVKLVGYLETVTDRLTIDLVTVSSYKIGDSLVMVPQRIDPERIDTEFGRDRAAPRKKGQLYPGAEEFTKKIGEVQPEPSRKLSRLAKWAVELEGKCLAKVSSFHGLTNWTLLPKIQPENVGFVTIWADPDFTDGYIQLWRSVFERNAPKALKSIEEKIAPETIGQGKTIREIDDELMGLLTEAYREANEAD